MTADRHIPEATVARLPVYLRCLVEVAELKLATISSERLAELAGVNAAKLRKDLSYLGSYGTRGVGYDVEFLMYQIGRQLGLTQDWPIVIVGIGNLGHALANYRGFAARGFRIVALLDADLAKVGEQLGDHRVRSMSDLDEVVRGGGVAIGVIATPAVVAQEVADRLVAAGVTSILNFAPTILSVPEHVALRKVDLSIELQILSFYQQRAVSAAARPAIQDTAGNPVAPHSGSPGLSQRRGPGPHLPPQAAASAVLPPAAVSQSFPPVVATDRLPPDGVSPPVASSPTLPSAVPAQAG